MVKTKAFLRLHKSAFSTHVSKMLPASSGSFRLFRIGGVDVFIHWSWFLVAWYFLSTRAHAYSSWVWNAVEYLALFLIVLIHEFGHVLACRQVGGVSREIVLWPLGGVAFSRPPPRPGAELWTVVAGPLVNVVLWPLLLAANWASAISGISEEQPDFARLLAMLWLINKWLLIFNVLPIYPLDGGQILRSLLWFRIGRGRSLHLACSIGLVGIAGFAAYRIWNRPDDLLWTAVMAMFLGSQCLAGLRQSRGLIALEDLPKHVGFACPACAKSPPGGPIWLCQACGNRFDAFSTQAVCPHCQTLLPLVACVHCGAEHAVGQWERNPGRRRGSEAPYVDI